MAEGTKSKMGIGCCSAIAIVACAAVMIGVIGGKRAWTYFKKAAEEQSEIVVVVEQWEGSLDGAASTPQSLSPESVGDFQRKEQTLDAEAPGFSLGATGLLDVYGSGGDEIRIWIAETSQIGMSAAIDKIKEQVDGRFSIKSTTSFFMNGAGRLSYSGSPPDEQGLMINTDDRIFLIQSNDKSADLQEFLLAYIEAGMGNAGESDGGARAASESEEKSPEAEEKNATDAEPK